ncbi:hypothetical protein RhiJN_01281 [Ceratobasidium sp. AG-Ba]|nr:hypothetical protein RhiJN_01281 [Ceratobasidium sp. AG-Ba]QRW02308.1 hypothetical protein RhiLY_01306 [Ceratobasidium sp. AG-Ba]
MSGTLASGFKSLLEFGSRLSELDPTGATKVTFSVCAMAWEYLENQMQPDEILDDLVNQLGRIVPTITSVQDIANADLGDTLTAMLNLVEDASLLILNYRSHRPRALNSATQDRIRNIVNTFMNLRAEFDNRVGAQALIIAQSALSLEKLGAAANASFNPSRVCTTGTRVCLIEEIIDWSQDFNSERRLLWLYGFAGLGKSAVAASVCKLLDEKGMLAASFFCKRDHRDLRDAKCLLNTAIYGLAMRHKSYGQAVANAIQEDSQICTTHIQRRYISLVERPLKGIGNRKGSKRLVIVIDALDEITKDEERSSLLICLQNMCQLVPWLNIIVTSRPDEDIKDAFNPEVIPTVCRNIALANADADIYTFVERRMDHIAKSNNRPKWPREKIQDLASSASGLFIWAETACKFIEAGFEPEARLQQVLMVQGLTGRSDPFTGLDKLYATTISNMPKDEGEDNRALVRLCIGTIVATSAHTPLPICDLERLLSRQMEPGTLQTILKYLSSVIYEDGGSGGPVRIFHPSFEDYITDPTRSNEYYVEMEYYNTLIANSCLTAMLTELRFNICGLRSSHVPNTNVTDLDSQVRSIIAGHLRYSCLHWYSHFSKANIHSLVDKLRIFLFESHLLFWLEVLSLLGKLDTALTSMLGLNAISRHWDMLAEFSEYAKDVYRFVLSFYDAISNSTPHLYISALPFTPRASKLREKMCPLFPNTLSVSQGTQEEWTSCLRSVSHPGDVFSAAFSPDDRFIVSGCGDHSIRMWDTETGSEIMSFSGHESQVLCVAYSPDGRRIASTSYETIIRIWDSRTGPEDCELLVGHSKHAISLAFSPTSVLLASGSADHTVRVWDLRNRTCALILNRHTERVMSVCFSPNGRYIASSSEDKSVVIWDAKTGLLAQEPIFENTAVYSVAFSPDSSLIAYGTYGGRLMTIHLQNSSQAAEFLGTNTVVVQSVSFSPNGQRIISGSSDGAVRVWDVASGREIGNGVRKHSNRVWSVAYSSDSRRIVSCSSDKTMRIWDAEADNSIGVVSKQLHSTQISCVAVSSDGRLMATGSSDDMLRIWDAMTGLMISEPLQGHFGTVTSVAFSHKGRRVASGSEDETVLIWDLETATVVGPLRGHNDSVSSVVFSPDDRFIASGSHDHIIHIRDAETGDLVLAPLVGHTDRVRSVAFSPDGSIIVSGSEDKTIMIWDVKTGTPRFAPSQGHSDSVTSVVVFSNSKYIASCSLDLSVKIWDADTGQLVQTLLQPFPSDHLLAITISPGGRYIVCGSADQSLRIWDLDSDIDVPYPLYGHSDIVRSVAFFPEGWRVVSSSDDGTLRIWDISKAWPTYSLPSPQMDIFEDLTTLETFELTRRAGSDGWVKSHKGDLVLWLPVAHRDIDESLMCLTTEGVCPRGRIDFSRFVHGGNWASVMAVG